MSELTEVEQRAQRMGWVPQDQFRGDESKYIDAETFVRRAEELLPIALKTNKALDAKYVALESRNKALESKVSELTDTIKEFGEYHKNVSKREYDRAMADLKRQEREAVSLGNTQAFDQIQTQKAELEATKPVEKKPDTTPKDTRSEVQKSDEQHFNSWVKENPWFNKDRILRGATVEMANIVEQEMPHLLGTAEFYPEVEKRIKEEFPHKFQNPKRSEPGAVHGGSDQDSGGKKGKGYNDLPAEAKKACDKFVKQIPGFTREQYLATYEW